MGQGVLSRVRAVVVLCQKHPTLLTLPTPKPETVGVRSAGSVG
mgnify:CR=1 FL=1